MSPTPILDPAAREVILAHLWAEYPEEGGGVLLGRTGAPPHVLEAFPCRNVDPGDRTSRYTLSPEDLVRALAHSRSRSLRWLGFYHSHPGRSPEFSAADRAAAWPRSCYLTVALRPGSAAELAWHQTR